MTDFSLLYQKYAQDVFRSAYFLSGNQADAVGKQIPAKNHCNFANSALACFRIGISGSASFQSVRKS